MNESMNDYNEELRELNDEELDQISGGYIPTRRLPKGIQPNYSSSDEDGNSLKF